MCRWWSAAGTSLPLYAPPLPGCMARGLHPVTHAPAWCARPLPQLFHELRGAIHGVPEVTPDHVLPPLPPARPTWLWDHHRPAFIAHRSGAARRRPEGPTDCATPVQEAGPGRVPGSCGRLPAVHAQPGPSGIPGFPRPTCVSARQEPGGGGPGGEGRTQERPAPAGRGPPTRGGARSEGRPSGVRWTAQRWQESRAPQAAPTGGWPPYDWFSARERCPRAPRLPRLPRLRLPRPARPT